MQMPLLCISAPNEECLELHDPSAIKRRRFIIQKILSICRITVLDASEPTDSNAAPWKHR